ncbi:MAG: trehalose-phosphatase [Burkholderiaceae bacterium]|nr:trehalose-phosphatase [Burkholderiaceae bacterium]
MTLTSMLPEPAGAFDILVRGLTGQPPPALFLDVDGTLLDIAMRPDRVVVPPSLRIALARIHDGLAGALALVSGRPVDELDRLFAPLRLPAAGAHGAHWRRRSAGGTERLPDIALPAAIRADLFALQARHPGLILEDKHSSIAIHFRERPALARALATAVGSIVEAAGDDSILVLPGKAVLEVKRSGFDKARAIRILMAGEPFAGRRPIFIGDDITDRVALDAVSAAGGIALSVERPIGRAAGVFATAADVREAIERVAGLLEARA